MDAGPSNFMKIKDQVTSDKNELYDIDASRESYKFEYDGSDWCLQDVNLKGTKSNSLNNVTSHVAQEEGLSPQKNQRTEEGNVRSDVANVRSDVAQEDGLPPRKKRRTDEGGGTTNTVPESAQNLDLSTYLLHKTWQDVAVTAAPAGPGSSSMNIVENEMRCSICSELFVKAVTLNCSHSFCDYCIAEWRKNSEGCPICREHIHSVSPTLVLDNFIEKILETAPEHIKRHREEVILERERLRLELLPNSGMMEVGSEEETDDGEGYGNDDEDDESHDEFDGFGFDENGSSSDDSDDQDNLYGNEDEENYDEVPENDDGDEDNYDEYYENGDSSHENLGCRCPICDPEYNHSIYNCVLENYSGTEVISMRTDSLTPMDRLTLMDIIFNRRDDYFN